VADDSTESQPVEKTVIPPRGGYGDLYVEHPTYEVHGHPSHHYESVAPEVIRLTEVYEASSTYSEKPTEPQSHEFRPSSPMPSAGSDALLSEQAKTSSTQAFSKLMEAAAASNHQPHQKEESFVTSATAGVTLDHLIAEIARPMIKQWLDNHLPGLVESLVNKEIEKITRQLSNR
jgi:hypothetical protein